MTTRFRSLENPEAHQRQQSTSQKQWPSPYFTKSDEWWQPLLRILLLSLITWYQVAFFTFKSWYQKLITIATFLEPIQRNVVWMPCTANLLLKQERELVWADNCCNELRHLCDWGCRLTRKFCQFYEDYWWFVTLLFVIRRQVKNEIFMTMYQPELQLDYKQNCF